MTNRPAPTEFEIIARYFAPLAAAEPGAGDLLDDAAVLQVQAGKDLVVSTDTIVEGTHFLPDEDGATLALRLLAVGFSDIAAMGAQATGYTVSLTLPRDLRGGALESWLAGFSTGLQEGQTRLGAVLIGGDTVVAPTPLSLTLTAFGEATPGRALRRAGAVAGDVVWVSGTIGDAALGLRVLRGELAVDDAETRSALIGRYRRPTARLALGGALVGLAHAAADVSDGLVADLGHICKASRVAAVVEAPDVPLSPAARAVLAGEPSLLPIMLAGGDDYELVFTAPPSASTALHGLAARLGLPLTRIGRIVPADEAAAPPVRVIDASGRFMHLAQAGYAHL